MGGILFKHGAGGLGVVDGHAGEEQKSDGRDDHEGGVAGGEDHENHFGDDKHDEADEKDGAGLEHVDLGGASEHGEREEEAGAQCEGNADGAKIVGHEDGAEGEAHERRIHVEHDVCGGDLHCMDARAKVDGKHDFNDGGGEDADDARGLDECQVRAAHLGDDGDHGSDDQTKGHVRVCAVDGTAFGLLVGIGGLHVDCGGTVGRIGVLWLRIVLVVLLVVLVLIVEAVILGVVTLGLLTECHNRSFLLDCASRYGIFLTIS